MVFRIGAIRYRVKDLNTSIIEKESSEMFPESSENNLIEKSEHCRICYGSHSTK